jgi:hypothetical protein
MAGPPAAPVGLPEGDVRILRWQDRSGRTCVAWWQADSEVATVGTVQLELPPAAIVVDPLHARLLNLGPGARLPLCRWPLLARSGER